MQPAMTQPACVPAREPVYDTPTTPPAPLRLKLFTLSLPFTTTFLSAAIVRSLSPLLRVPEMPGRIAPESVITRSVGGPATVRYGRPCCALSACSPVPAALVSHCGPGTRQIEGRGEDGKPALPRTSRVRALGCADVCGSAAARTHRFGESGTRRPRSQGRLAHARWAVRMCADGAFFAQLQAFPAGG